jgi:hypothetical protein
VLHLSVGVYVGERVGLHFTGVFRGKVVFLGSAVLSGGLSSVGSLGMNGVDMVGADGCFFFESTFVGIAVGIIVGNTLLKVGLEVGSIPPSRLNSFPVLAMEEVSMSGGKKKFQG